MQNRTSNEITVWDPFVRVFHWTLVLAFLTAYFVEPEGSLEIVHVWAGYVVTVLVLLRIVWGFVGTKHARFSDFLYGPKTGIRYLVDMLHQQGKRYLGHSPAGAWMIYMLLAGLLVTTFFGMAIYAIEDGSGPLAFLFAGGATGGESAMKDFYEEGHDLLGNLMLVLVILHLCGVAAGSYAHRENLPRSMVTGRKRAGE
jgi:cytochrome b